MVSHPLSGSDDALSSTPLNTEPDDVSRSAEQREQSVEHRRGKRTMAFRKRSNAPKPTAEQSRRQGQLVQYAWQHFGEAAPMIAFLNAPHEELARQPLELAIESDEGLERVRRLLHELTYEA